MNFLGWGDGELTCKDKYRSGCYCRARHGRERRIRTERVTKGLKPVHRPLRNRAITTTAILISSNPTSNGLDSNCYGTYLGETGRRCD